MCGGPPRESSPTRSAPAGRRERMMPHDSPARATCSRHPLLPLAIVALGALLVNHASGTHAPIAGAHPGSASGTAAAIDPLGLTGEHARSWARTPRGPPRWNRRSAPLQPRADPARLHDPGELDRVERPADGPLCLLDLGRRHAGGHQDRGRQLAGRRRQRVTDGTRLPDPAAGGGLGRQPVQPGHGDRHDRRAAAARERSVFDTSTAAPTATSTRTSTTCASTRRWATPTTCSTRSWSSTRSATGTRGSSRARGRGASWCARACRSTSRTAG